MLSMRIGERGPMKVLPKDALVIWIMAEIRLACLSNIDGLKPTKRTTVPHLNSHDGGPGQLKSDKQFTKRTFKQPKGAKGVRDKSMNLRGEPNLVQPLAKDLRERIELGLISTKRARIKVLDDAKVHPQGTCISDGFKGSKDKRVNR